MSVERVVRVDVAYEMIGQREERQPVEAKAEMETDGQVVAWRIPTGSSARLLLSIDRSDLTAALAALDATAPR